MNKYQRNGLIVGAAIGLLTAIINWEGNWVRALATVAGGALFGYLIGRFIQKNGV